MKKFPLASLVIFLSIYTLSAQELLHRPLGQIFEQGYGRAYNDWENEESAHDIIATPTGIAMSGWMDNEGKDMALWHIDEVGRLILFGEYGSGGYDEVAASLALSSTGQTMLVGRRSDYFGDSYRSQIISNDKAQIRYIDTDGGELWSWTLDSNDSDTDQVAVDIFNAGSDEFVILINRLYGEHGNQTFRVLKIQSNSNVMFDKTYFLTNAGNDQNLFAEKIIDKGNGRYLVLANDIDNQHVVLVEIADNDGTYETHENYPQPNPTYGGGISSNISTGGFIIAGSEDNGIDKDGFILETQFDLTEAGAVTHTNEASGNEEYRDITAHAGGYLAIGECDNRGEGQRDVWICHLDSLADTVKVETLGGEENDYGHSATLIPQVYSVFVAGYNNSYTIEESGNAYLVGVKVDMGLPENSGECKVPRILFVDFFTWNLGGGVAGIDLNNYILGNTSRENALIAYAQKHNIGYLALYGVNFIFEPGYQSHSTTQQAKNALNDFIDRCFRGSPSVRCALISTTKEAVYTNAIDYNKDVTAGTAPYNYKSNGKLSYFILEHEFWNPHTINVSSGPTAANTAPDFYDNEDASTANDVPANKLDGHFVVAYNEHLDILDKMDQNKNFDANVLGMIDYLGYFYNRYSPTSPNNHPRSNITNRQTKATAIEAKCDAMLLTYYQRYSSAENGIDFLSTTFTSGAQYVNVETWKERISLLGKQSGKKTNIIPLFSAENDISGKACGKSNKFLGEYLAGLPVNTGSGNFKSAETAYYNQHQPFYASTTTPYDYVKNLNVAAGAWYTYSCVDLKDFGSSNNGLPSCQSFNTPLNSEEVPSIATTGQIKLFPNPTSGTFTITIEGKDRYSTFKVYDAFGRICLTGSCGDQKNLDFDLSSLNSGMYFIHLVGQSHQSNIRVLKE